MRQANKEMKVFHESFYSYIDESLLHHYLGIYSKNSGNQTRRMPGLPCGAGAWFEAYRFQAGKKNPGESFVLSLPNRFNGEHEEIKRFYTRWFDRMKRIREAGKVIPLIPPFVLLRSENGFPAWSSPYGEAPDAANLRPSFPDLSACREQMFRDLEALGLTLEDHIQLRCWRGIPFICDLSDLRDL